MSSRVGRLAPLHERDSVRHAVSRPDFGANVLWSAKLLVRRYVGAQQRHQRIVLAVQLLYLTLFGAWLVGSYTWPALDLVATGMLVFAILTARGLRFLRDWTPFLVLTLAYVALPGVTPGLLGRVHVGFPITVDRWLGFGELPTTRLQAWLWDASRRRWWDYGAAALYFLHFITPLALAFLFWQWRRPLYWQFVAAYLLLMYAGFATYLIYPMAPPWWAGELGRIPRVQPVLASVQWHGVTNPVVLLSRYFQSDPVAAMPSMHAAFPFLVWLVLWRSFPRWGWAVVFYPLAMTFAVVYAGEHYLIDCLAGWLYAAVAFALVWACPQALRRTRGSRTLLDRKAVTHQRREDNRGVGPPLLASSAVHTATRRILTPPAARYCAPAGLPPVPAPCLANAASTADERPAVRPPAAPRAGWDQRRG